jgi:hypothetical protein
MSVLNEALEFLGLGGDSAPHERYELRIVRTRKEQRELAATMRRLPGCFAGRISGRTVERIQASAAAGRWEQAIDELLTALHTHDAPVTGVERAELRAALVALDMSADRVGHLRAADASRGATVDEQEVASAGRDGGASAELRG